MDLKVPSGTQPGTTLVMAKRGVPRLGSSNVRGDHQVSASTSFSSEAMLHNPTLRPLQSEPLNGMRAVRPYDCKGISTYLCLTASANHGTWRVTDQPYRFLAASWYTGRIASSHHMN